MDHRLKRPVHLYVKTHRLTGLKYFGRTTEDPRSYQGSGAYWTRHLATYGSEVRTTVIGTYEYDSELRAAARAFSAEHDIASSTKWANLLPEDGGTAGEGWKAGHDHDAQIAALDAAVQRRMNVKKRRREREEAERREEAEQAARDERRGTYAWHAGWITLAVVAMASGVYWQSGSVPGDGYADGFEYMHFFLGFFVAVVSPIGWIPAAVVGWIVHRIT